MTTAMKSSRGLILPAAVLAFGVTSSLGVWQLSRAMQKTEMAQQLEMRRAQPALDLSGGENAAWGHEFTDRSVQVRGHWLGELTVYLDNRQMDGRPGFWVMTPLQIRDSDALVVVQRGWVPRNFQDRQALPAVPHEDGLIEVQGRIAAQPGKLLELGAGSGGQIRQNLDLSAYAQELKKPVLAFMVVQTGPDSQGMRRQWPTLDSGVHKHYGYAFQWFGLSILWVILYVWFQVIVPRRKRTSA